MPLPSSAAITSCLLASTAHIAPGSAAASAMRSPRWRATRSASSRPSAPEAASAVTSPKLCPTAQAAERPTLRSTARVARLAAPIAGCAHSVRVSLARERSAWSAAKPGRGNTTSCSGSFGTSEAAWSHTSRAQPRDVARPRPMPTYWLPCPGNTKHTPPSTASSETKTPRGLVCNPGRSASLAASSSLPTSSLALSATIAARAPPRASAGRWLPRAVRWLRSATCCSTEDSFSCSVSRAAASIARTSVASAVQAPASAALLSAASTTSSVLAVRRSAARLGPTYSSSATWKLEPPNPKALTPARRGCTLVSRIQGRVSVARWNGELSRSSFGLGLSILRVWGSTRWCSAITALNRPAAPAALLV